MNADDVVASTADPAFAADESGVVVGWNEAAEKLLGFAAEDVVGRPCHDILCGRDVFGNRCCDKSCSIACMARRNEPVARFEMDVLEASGDRLRARFSILVLPGPEPSRFTMIHIFEPAAAAARGPGPENAEPPAGAAGAAVDPTEVLTPREIEVLRLLATGNSSQDIADQLFVSLTTVRTHIQNVLRKLEVHSQLEAVALAFRKGVV